LYIVLAGISEPTSAGGAMNVQQGLKITEELVQRVEVVYVLGLFLLGKHRKKVNFENMEYVVKQTSLHEIFESLKIFWGFYLNNIGEV
jgi:Trpc4-associated protein